MLMGKDEPDSGNVKVGETVNMIGVGQDRMEELDPTKTVFEEITGGQDELELGTSTVNSRAYLSWFGFKGAQQQQMVQNLSGGERNRVQLAKLLKSGANLIILDEPTVRGRWLFCRCLVLSGPHHACLTYVPFAQNDLDVETLRSLEEALLEFAGSAIVVSHDRYFLDRVCTHIIACEGNSEWFFFPGNYADYEENKKERLGETSLGRVKYAPLVNA